MEDLAPVSPIEKKSLNFGLSYVGFIRFISISVRLLLLIVIDAGPLFSPGNKSGLHLRRATTIYYRALNFLFCSERLPATTIYFFWSAVISKLTIRLSLHSSQSIFLVSFLMMCVYHGAKLRISDMFQSKSFNGPDRRPVENCLFIECVALQLITSYAKAHGKHKSQITSLSFIYFFKTHILREIVNEFIKVTETECDFFSQITGCHQPERTGACVLN